MEQDLKCNIVNALYYLYFENRELVYHFERTWTEDGMTYEDEEYTHIFMGVYDPDFPVDLETYCFLCENDIVEETSGNEHERMFKLTTYYRQILTVTLKERDKESKTIAK
jgi:hypothetical protein